MTEIPPRPVKVVLDKVVSTVLLVGSSPLALAITAAIEVESLMRPASRAGWFHREIRVSAARPFMLYKFRILTPQGEAEIRAGAIPKHVENNPKNLTSVGRILKQIGLDELPQLYSVLIGKMSLIGPRPKPIPEYEEEIKIGNIFRAQLRAGLSGPVQVLKGTARKDGDAIRADFAYLELMRTGTQRQILLFDLKTLVKTARVLMRATGE